MTDSQDRVADAPPNHWVYRLLPPAVWPYAQLARWERPVGWWLLLWPCWWSLALALNAGTGGGSAPVPGSAAQAIVAMLALMGMFMLGAIAMRGAGCTWNDIIDTEIDVQVARTASRPIPSGRVTRTRAAVFLGLQAIVGLAVLLLLCGARPDFNVFALLLAFASLAVVAAYPFAKRVTDWPQLVLGLAFSWGALMGWAVIFGTLSAAPLLLYAACVSWTIGYDTIYAHQDREDDEMIGVRSTARLFGERTHLALVVFYGATLILMAAAFATAGVGVPAYLGLVAGAAHMGWQLVRLEIDDGGNCLRLFRSNVQFGWIVFLGLLIGALV